jgi:hypothetical protein
VYPGGYHAWDMAAPDAELSVRMVQERVDALRRALHPRAASEVQPA